jgi:hypothetical protein
MEIKNDGTVAALRTNPKSDPLERPLFMDCIWQSLQKNFFQNLSKGSQASFFGAHRFRFSTSQSCAREEGFEARGVPKVKNN